MLSFLHHRILLMMCILALKSFMKEGTTLGGVMPGEGGFDLCVNHNLGSEISRTLTSFCSGNPTPGPAALRSVDALFKSLEPKES